MIKCKNTLYGKQCNYFGRPPRAQAGRNTGGDHRRRAFPDRRTRAATDSPSNSSASGSASRVAPSSTTSRQGARHPRPVHESGSETTVVRPVPRPRRGPPAIISTTLLAHLARRPTSPRALHRLRARVPDPPRRHRARTQAAGPDQASAAQRSQPSSNSSPPGKRTGRRPRAPVRRAPLHRRMTTAPTYFTPTTPSPPRTGSAEHRGPPHALGTATTPQPDTGHLTTPPRPYPHDPDPPEQDRP